MKKRIRLLFLVLLFIIFSVGISYSYFIYRRSSDTSVININLGETKVKKKKVGNQEIETVSTFPMSAADARSKNDNYYDFDIELTNNTDEDMSYCIGLEYGNDLPDKDRIDLQYVSFDLKNRTNGFYYLNSVSFDNIDHAECIFVKDVPAGTTSLTDKFQIRLWLNTGVTSSDTDTSSVFKATDDNLLDERLNYNDLFASFNFFIEAISNKEYRETFTMINDTELTTGLDSSVVNAKTLKFNLGYDDTYDDIPDGFKKNNLQVPNHEPIYSYYDSDNYKLVVFSESYIYTSTSISNLFTGLTNLETIDFNNFYLNNVTTLARVFYNLTNLETIDLDFSTPINTSLAQLFSGCTSLTDVYFGENFSTASTTAMTSMFRDCSSLTSLDLSSFDFSKNATFYYAFNNCTNLVSIDFGYADFKNVTNMQETFADSTNLENIYWNITNTSNLNNFNRTFCNCNSLVNLDVSNFTLNSCTSMSNTFKNCISLIEIDLSNVSKTGNIKMQSTFLGCDSLKVIKLPNMDFSRVTEMYGCFKDCINLERIDAQFNTSSSLTLTYEMFQNDAKIKYLDLNNMDVSSVINLYTMFSGCTQLETLLIDEWDVSSAASFNSLFNNCSSLINLDLSKWKNSISTSYYYMFYGCSSLKIVDLSGLDNSLVTSFTRMFCNCTNLETIFVNENWVNPTNINSSVFGGNINLVGGSGTAFDSSKATSKYLVIDTPNTVGYLTLKSSNTGDVVTGDSLLVNFNTLVGTTGEPNDYRDLFGTITSIKFDNRKHNSFKIDVSYYGDGSVWMYVDGSAAYVSAPSKIVFPVDSTSLFESFVNVEIINFNDWVDTSNVTQFANAFRNLSKLESLDFTGLDMSKVQSFERTFYNCTTITSIDLSNLNLSSLQSMFLAFGQDYEMTTCNFSGTTTTDNLTSLYSTFYRCRALTSLDLSGFDTSNVTAMRSTFNECQSLTTIDVSNFDTTQTDNMYRMFYKCSSLTTIYVSSSFVTTAVTSSGGMFTESTLLVGGNGTVYDSSHVDVTYAVIDTASTPGYFTLKS